MGAIANTEKCIENKYYRIKDKVVTMVYRHIHSTLISISTNEVITTDQGYISKRYTSQYQDPKTNKPISAVKHFNDTYSPLYIDGPWVLTERLIHSESYQDIPELDVNYSFYNLKNLV